MTVEVARLGAWCDMETEDDYRQRLAARGPETTDHVGEPGYGPIPLDQVDFDAFRRAMHFRVEEFADLSDGRRLAVTDDRGWSCGGPPPDELWACLTVDDIISSVLAVVSPDDAEDTGKEHPWEWLAERIRSSGVETTAEHLKGLPYDVVLSDRLLARMGDRRWLAGSPRASADLMEWLSHPGTGNDHDLRP